MIAGPTLLALKGALGFEPVGQRAGNVTLGRGTLDGATVHVALLENHMASGALGVVEGKRLEALLRIVAKERSPLVLFIDSAGARVSEGLAALGAFRRLFRAVLDAASAGAPVAAVLGPYCYGGASMVAHLATARLFSPGTMLAMSGPSVLAAAAGANALDDMFKAMSAATLSAEARAKASAANQVFHEGDDVAAWLRQALAPSGDPAGVFRMRHEGLGIRLAPAAHPQPEPLRRKEFERLFAEGYDARDQEGLVTGQAQRGGNTEFLLGLMSTKPVGAERAWRFADHAWRLVDQGAKHVHVLLDCESHAPRLEDEKVVLSEYIVGMSLALTALRLSGAHVEMTIVDRAGGGVYVALAAAASHVGVVYGSHVQVLPGGAIAAILGDSGAEPDPVAAAAEAVAAGVADAQVKLGLIDILP